MRVRGEGAHGLNLGDAAHLDPDLADNRPLGRKQASLLSGAVGAPLLAALLVVAWPGEAALRRATADERATLRIVGLPTIGSDSPSGSNPLAAAGDVNGDGLTDLVVGSPDEDSLGRRDAGAAYVIFGRPGRRTVDVRRLGDAGFRIDGAPPALPVELDDRGPAGERAGASVAGVGDVNGDGLDDIALGAPRSSAGGRPLAGRVYVVFGTRTSDGVDLGSLGTRGYRIQATTPSGFAGTHVAGAGDVNGDGRPDVVLSGRRAAYAAFGKTDWAPLDLGSESAAALTLRTPRGEYLDDFPVAGAGDANGDGLADVVIGAPGLEPRKRYRAGGAYVVFGRRGAVTLDLTRLGDGGLRIDGEDYQGAAGSSVGGAGDVNGDGLADVVLGAPEFGIDGSDETFDYGAAYVVFGRAVAGRLDLGRLRDRGLRVYSEPLDTLGELGTAVAGAGDVNGDGLADVALGAPGLNANCRRDTGASYVVYGRRRGVRMVLSRLGAGGFRLDGPRRDTRLGATLAALRDASGDRRPDLLIGSEPQGRRRARPPIVVSATPPARTTAAVPDSRCLQAALLTRRIRTLLRSGRIPLRVTALEVRGRGAGVFVGVWLLDRKGQLGATLGAGGLRFSRPGARIVRLKLSGPGRRSLLRRARVRVEVVFAQDLGEGDYRFLGRVERLRR